MSWYLIHTKPRQEKCAFINLEQQGYKCYLPMLAIQRPGCGTTSIEEPLFPRYLFIQLEQGNYAKNWAPIRSTRGVSRLVSFGTVPAKVQDELIDLLLQQEILAKSTPTPMFEPGEIVRFTQGALDGLEGIYKMPQGEHRVMVLIELMNKPLIVRVSRSSLRKVS